MPNDPVSLLLQSLGDTQEDVAASLRKLGCRGHLPSGDECPVARFLAWAGCRDVNIGLFGFCVTDPTGRRIARDVPLAVAKFILRFDDGLYPDLVAQEDDESRTPITSPVTIRVRASSGDTVPTAPSRSGKSAAPAAST